MDPSAEIYRLLLKDRIVFLGAEVSDELGFAAPSHFARFFVQHMGVPPSDYRRGVIVEDE